MRGKPRGSTGMSDGERERMALIRRGVTDLQHDLSKCQREVTQQLEEQMASMEPPLPQALLDAYDEVQRIPCISRRNLEACEEGIIELLKQ